MHIDQRQEPEYLAVLAYIENISNSIAAHFRKTMPSYFPDTIPQWRSRPFWMNHCENCKSKISDFDIIESAVAPLNPTELGTHGVSFAMIPISLQARAVFHRRKLRHTDTAFRTFLETVRKASPAPLRLIERVS